MNEPNFRPEFSAGSVFSQAFGIFGSNLGPFFALAAVGLAPFVLTIYGYSQILPAIDAAKNGGTPPEMPGWVSLVNLATSFLSMVASAAMMHGALSRIEGRAIDIGESLGVGFRRFLPLLGVSIVAGLVWTLGLLLLIVPGLILICGWYMALPVAVAERRGVFGSLGRAWNLSKGRRWTLFGIGVLYALLGMAGYFIVGIGACVVGFASGASTGGDAPSAMAMFAVLAPLGTLFYVAGAAIHSILCAVTYHGLRTEKDGDSPAHLQNVFG